MASVDQLIDELLRREGGYVNNPADHGGPTNFGITEAVARSEGYTGEMRDMPRVEAFDIYRKIYWVRPGFDQVSQLSDRVAAEMFDTGVNMGPAVPIKFLQRLLTALNREGKDYADLPVTGHIGTMTINSLRTFLQMRGKTQGELILLHGLDALQGEHYVAIAEHDHNQERFLNGWLSTRIGNAL